MPAPEDLMYLFYWWKYEVAKGEPLDHKNLYYWNKVSKRQATPWECNVVMQIDRVYWTVKSEE